MASVTDFDQVSGLMPRLLGWLPDGSAVVEVRVSTGFMADYPAVPIYRTEVLALAPGGGRRELIGLPGNVHHVEVARDLVTAGRFGAAPAPTAARFADWARGLLPHLFVVVVAVAALVGWRAWRRKLRDLGRPVAPWRHQTSKIAERLTRAASGHPPRP
jgi:hypothetical protein